MYHLVCIYVIGAITGQSDLKYSILIYLDLKKQVCVSCLVIFLPEHVFPSGLSLYPGRQLQVQDPGKLSQICSQPCSDSRHRSIPAAQIRPKSILIITTELFALQCSLIHVFNTKSSDNIIMHIKLTQYIVILTIYQLNCYSHCYKKSGTIL